MCVSAFRIQRPLVAAVLSLVLVATMTATSHAEDEESLTIGDWYRVTVRRGEVARSYEGTLVKANEKWLVLNDVSNAATREGVPLLMDLPGAGKWFARDTTLRTETDAWLPIDAVSIEAHRAAGGTANDQAFSFDEPRVKTAYFVESLVGGKLASRKRDLLNLKNDVLLFGPANASPTGRESVNRSDLVAMRVVRVERIAKK